MRDMKILMKWAFFLVLICLVFSSCKDDFDVNKLQDSPRLVLYSFPTVGDTTFIAVSKSMPITSFKGDKDVQSRQKVDARVVYKVNGVEQLVKRIESKQEAQLFTQSRNDSCLSWLVGQYYAVGKQRAGDKIDIQVSSEGLASVSASTYIPNSVGLQLGDVRLNQNGSDGESNVDKLEATFHDEASTQDYYSVGVFVRQKCGVAVGKVIGEDMPLYARDYYDYLAYEDRYRNEGIDWNLDSLTWELSDLSLITEGEPLLNKRSKLDDDFGFDYYTYFNNQYIFNDRMINGQNYTLHLETTESYSSSGYVYGSDGYYYNNLNWNGMFGRTYIVQLCKMTPEYYRFLKSINDAQSNSWADAGLMQVTPTYSNVKGGFGVVGGYNASTSSKHVVLPSSDGKYYEE